MSINSSFSNDDDYRSSSPSSGSSSGSDSDSDSSDDGTSKKLMHQQQRLSNLPTFHVPGQSHPHKHHRHHRHRKPKFRGLTRAETEAVVSTFTTFVKFAGVRHRRKELNAYTTQKLQDNDVGKASPLFNYDRILDGIGDILDKNNEALKKVSSSTHADSTTWRKLATARGTRRLSVEIIKQDKKSIRDHIKHSQHHAHAHKALFCQLCCKEFKKSQLLGRVSRMSIARLKEKWAKKRARVAKAQEVLKQKRRGRHYSHSSVQESVGSSVEQYTNHNLSRAYDLVRVCAFCLQFFGANEVDDKFDPGQKETMYEDEYKLVNKVGGKVGFPEPLSSCTLIKQPKEIKKNGRNVYTVQYRSTNRWKSFEQSIAVTTKNRVEGVNAPRARQQKRTSSSPRKRLAKNLLLQQFKNTQ